MTELRKKVLPTLPSRRPQVAKPALVEAAAGEEEKPLTQEQMDWEENQKRPGVSAGLLVVYGLISVLVVVGIYWFGVRGR